VLVGALAFFATSSVESVEAPRPGEYEVKAAFLYNFAKFVKWPDEAATGATFVIGVLGDDPFGPALEKTLHGKTVLDKTVEVRRFASPEAARDARIVFVAASEKNRLKEILKTLAGSAVLTVGDMDGFADRGGMIAFQLRDEAVRFDINLEVVEHANLKMSSQLIRLAQRVIGANGG
jgi:hypothetical protein